MQPFSPDQNPAEAWQTLVSTVGIGRLIVLGVGSIVLGILANWIASLCVASERATLGRAALTWVAGIALGIVLAIGFGVVAAVVMPAAGPAARLGLIVAFLCGLLAGVLGIPMKIYEIGVLRAVGFLLITALVGGAMQTGLQFALLGTLPDQGQWEQVTAMVTAKSKAEEAAEVEAIRGALRIRQADLARRHAALEIRRKYLPPGNSSAREEYEQERIVYERDLEQLRMEASALPPQ